MEESAERFKLTALEFILCEVPDIQGFNFDGRNHSKSSPHQAEKCKVAHVESRPRKQQQAPAPARKKEA